jgi:cytochrome P450
MSDLHAPKPTPSKGQAGADPFAIPLHAIDVSDPELFETDTHWAYFERLRREDPIHYCARSDFGSYWSVTRYDDVVEVEKNPQLFSSRQPPRRLEQGAHAVLSALVGRVAVRRARGAGPRGPAWPPAVGPHIARGSSAMP